ncbi:MAG: chorismate mutase / prephenate dehydratase [Gaiellaceae bacterium]|nr:chorismate mutase / prephenate dehydratase [Gaiellaceae bacterium]
MSRFATTPIAYPGPAGSHTASAAAALFPSGQLVPLGGFRAVADAVVGATATHGVLPIESSLVGPVAETHDLLYDRALSIVAETVLPITHCLAGPESIPLDRIRIVRSHPTALDQCRDLLAELSQASVIFAPTTADAARQAAEDGDPTEVAIVGKEAAVLYGLTVLADDIGDHTAFTRFVSIAPYTSIDVPLASARTAFSFVTRHQPGALHAAIAPFAKAGLDLQRLVSRPLPSTPWKYRFDAVVAGHPLDPAVRLALRDVKAATRELRVVGIYEGHEEGE